MRSRPLPRSRTPSPTEEFGRQHGTPRRRRRSVREQIEGELYAAPERRLLKRLRAVEDDVTSLLLIGHNPGVEQLALSLAGGGQKLAVLSRKYPTGALATLEFSGRWGDLRPGRAELTDFVTPKQLAKR